MAELRIALDTQSAAASARDLQRILNDIKMAARDLDNMSLWTLGSTISRVADSMRTMQSAVSSAAPTVASIVTAVQGLSQALEGGIRSQQAWVQQWQAFNGTGNYARQVLASFTQAMTNMVGVAATIPATFAQSNQQLMLFTTSATAAQQALSALVATARNMQSAPILLPQVTQTSQQAAAQIQGQVQGGAFPPTYGRSVGAQPLPPPIIAPPGGYGGGAGTQAMFASLQGPTTQQAAQQSLAATQQTTTATVALGQAFTQAKAQKDPLDKNLQTMSSSSGSLWQMSFALRTLASLLGALSFRALYEEAKQLAETLVDTGMQLERATALFGLMGNSSMTSAQGIELATKTAQEFGLAVLPAIEGLGKMQASAYGTAAAGDAVNTAFKGMMAGLGATAADSRLVTSAMTALSDSIGRVEISGRTIRQISRDFPGFRERMAEAFGAKDVEHFMLILDKGHFTVSQYLNAFQQAFSGTVMEMAKQNVNTLSGAVTGFHNALLAIGQAILDAGFKRDFIQGIQDLTAVLTSQAFLDGARQFGEIFGVVVKGALELFATVIDYVKDHLALFGGVLTGIISAGGMLTFAGAILTLARAFQILGLATGSVLGPIGLIAAAVGIGVGLWMENNKATADAQKVTDALANAQKGLATTNKEVAASVPTEHMVRYAKDEKTINDEIEKLRLTTVGYRDELGLLESGIQKDSAAFTGLAAALKFYNEQASHGNVAFDQANVQRLKEYAVAAQAAAAGVAKIAENRNQLRIIREESDITQSLTTMAAGGASEGVLTIERTFQEQFRTMRAHFEDLIYNERDMSTRNKLVEQFKQQAEALRESSVQAQLYANRLKAIQDLTQGARNLALEKEITAILSSPLREGATKPVNESTPSALEVSRPPTVNPASESINAFMYQLDRANIGAQRQQLNGPVEMTITGNVTVNGMGGRAGGGGTAATGAYADLVNQYSEAAGIRPVVAQAVLNVESRGRAGATNPKGAGGLMQLMPGTAADLGVGNVYDPAQNIEGGTRYLSQLARQFGDDLVKTIAAYNAGPGAVKAAGGVPNYPETQKYVTDVLREIQQMEQQKPAGTATGTPVMEQGIFSGSLSSMRDAIRAIFGSVPTRKDLEEDVNASPSLNLEGRYQNTANEIFNKIVDELTQAEPSPEVLAKLHARLDALLAPQAQDVGANLSAMFPETAMMLRQVRENARGSQPAQLAIDIEKTSADNAAEEARRRAERQRMQEVADLRRQQELGTLYAEQQGVQPTALGGAGFTPGRLTAARRPRTQLEMERDIAGVRAVSRFDENVQLRAPQYDISRYQFGLATPEQEQLLTAPRTAPGEPRFQRDLNLVMRQRQEAEFQGRAGVDQATMQAQARFNTELEKQNMNLKIAQEFISTDAKYRDIDAKAAQAQQKALENSVSPELLARTQSLIEEERQLAHAQVDMNGPIQQSIDSIGTFKDRSETLFIGALNGMGDALATFATTGKFDIKSFADAFIADLVRMAYQLFLMKPLLMAIQGQGTFGENLIAGLGGTPESAYGSDLGGMTTSAETLSGLEESIATIGGGASTGGYVTLRGIEHFQGGGMVGRGRDSVPAMLSPGEMILNQAQQRNVAASMQGGGITYVFNPTIHAQDAESVRKTLPQIQAEFYRSTQRMALRNNIRGNT